MTKKKTSETSSKRGIAATSEGIEKLKAAQKKAQKTDDGKVNYLSYEKIAEISGVSKTTVERFFRGKAIDIPFAQWITQALDLELSEVADTSQFESSEVIKINPQEINIPFQEMINQKLEELTSISLMSKDGINLNLQDIYIPLGLMEQKERTKVGNISPDKGLQISETEYKVTQEFENNEFFAEVLDQGITPKSQGKRIAILGEAGAGKSTLLQQIANYILTKNPDILVIWVSLADLKLEENLEDYLLEKWLTLALKERKGNVSESAKDKLIDTFKNKTVWLLLDGVDEMGMNNPLNWVNSQLEGWIGLAKVMLTCRLNVWDNEKNALANNFDVYRNLDFTESQVRQFIDNWFTKSNLTALANSLQKELDKTGKERIKNLIKNPLRLTLLCYAWQLKQGSLPETKAELYKWFVEAFYQWKKEAFPITSKQRKELNQALGELAKQALQQDSLRFRLTHEQIIKVLGEEDETLFKLALDIGWLNRIGVAEEDITKSVYSFLHPSFQEYFAALNIDDWDYFIPKTHNNLQPKLNLEKDYKIFNKNMKEVAAYWVGRNDISQNSKVAFLETILEFNQASLETLQDSNNIVFMLFEDRAYSIAIELFSDLSKNDLTGNLFEKVAVIMYDHVFNTNKYKQFGIDTAWLYEESIAKLNGELRLEILLNLFKNKNNDDSHIKWEALDLLEKIGEVSEKSQDLVQQILANIAVNEEYYLQEKFIHLAVDHITDYAKAQELVRYGINILQKRNNSHLNLAAYLYTLESLKEKNQQNQNSLTLQDFLEIISQTKSAKVCLHYLSVLLENLAIDEENNQDINDLFKIVIDIMSISDEDVEKIYPKDHEYEYVPRPDELGGDYEYSETTLGIKKFCAHVAIKLAKNNNNFVSKIIKKIIYILEMEKESHSLDFEYKINYLFESCRLISELARKELFVSCLNYIENRIKTQYDVLDENYGQFLLVVRRMCSLYEDNKSTSLSENWTVEKSILELNEQEKKKTVSVISGIIKSYNNQDQEDIIYVCRNLSELWKLIEPDSLEALNNLEKFENICLKLRQEQEKRERELWGEEEVVHMEGRIARLHEIEINVTLSQEQYNELKVNILIEFCPTNFNHISLLTDFLLKGNLEETLDFRIKNPYYPDRYLPTTVGRYQPKEVILIINEEWDSNKTWMYYQLISQYQPKDIKNKAELALHNLQKTDKSEFLQEIVYRLKPAFASYESLDSSSERIKLCFKALWHCAKNLTYQDFVKAWFRSNIHPEVAEYTSLGKTTFTQKLDQQYVSYQESLKPTNKTYPIVISLKSVEDETDQSAIAQELCNQIYQVAFPNEIIPEVNNAPQFKRFIPQIKAQLNTQQLSIIIQEGTPNETLIKFCDKLTDVIHFKWITEQPIKYGIPPQENLVNLLQNWLNEIR
jgi:transcriptional regulator with XRE-family HTH domain/energy-coupling factor transporter ATP-binding protein EcfA2